MIDQIARELTRPMPRRRALRLLGGAMAAALVPGLRVPVAAAAESCGALGCNGKCCSATDWSTPGLQGVCCEQDETCCLGFSNPGDPEHTYGWCCGADYECGQELDSCVATCKPPGYLCGDDCCTQDRACCPVTEDKPICCPEGQDCTKMITPGNTGITPDSPYVCCPPERLVTALTVSKICCPEGSVRQPGGGLSTAGGFCCTSGNVCGGTCCDSLPSFPKVCVDGKRCEFEFLVVEQEKVKLQRDGTVKVPVSMKQAHSATVSIVAAGASGRANAAAAKPLVLGKRKLAAKRGARTVRIRLSRRGRKLLRKHRKLRVHIVVSVRDGAGKAETTTPVTLRRR